MSKFNNNQDNIKVGEKIKYDNLVKTIDEYFDVNEVYSNSLPEFIVHKILYLEMKRIEKHLNELHNPIKQKRIMKQFEKASELALPLVKKHLAKLMLKG